MRNLYSICIAIIFQSYALYGQTSPTNESGVFIDKVIEYVPAPGQFVNTSFTNKSQQNKLIGGNMACLHLGYFGGYLVVGFNNPIKNHQDNPYGVDFTVFGNAFLGSSEPATVQVMKDKNGNGLPDDTWYELKGSDHWLSTTRTGVEITYTNPQLGETNPVATDVSWEDNEWNSGFILTNSYHNQSYYPLATNFPFINQKSYTLTGTLIKHKTTKGKRYVSNHSFDYGYADNHKRNIGVDVTIPDNPYTIDELEGCGADAFDISWAVDDQGKSVKLDEISFIRLYTAVAADGLALGEVSAEIAGIARVAPNASIKGVTDVIIGNHPTRKGEYPVNTECFLPQNRSFQFESYVISRGKLNENQDITFEVSDPTIATITNQGLLTPKAKGKVTVTLAWAQNPTISRTYQVEITEAVSTGINDQGKDYTLNIAPNPATDYINIDASVGIISSFRLYNLSGNIVKQETLNSSEATIQVNSLPNGMYLLELVINGQRTVNKVIIR